MKNLIILFFIFSLTCYSQDKIQQVEVIKTNTQIEKFSKNIGQNEFKVNLFDALVYESLHVGYERMNNTSTAYGATMLINLGDSELNDNFAVTPYFRVYFLESEDYGGYGFFAEVFSKFVFGDTGINEFEGFASDDENYFDIALGAALGRKWINNKGYSFEVRLGLGRNLLYESNQEDRTEGMASIGIALGKRF
jgi:putative salt-induced outer membrane protein YdiY